MLAKLPSPSGAQRRGQLTADIRQSKGETARLEGRRAVGRGATPSSHSWQLPEGLPVQLTSQDHKPPKLVSVWQTQRESLLSEKRLSHAFTHNPPQQSSGRSPCTCQYLKLKARCSNSTQLECSTKQTTQAGLMREEAPTSPHLLE